MQAAGGRRSAAGPRAAIARIVFLGAPPDSFENTPTGACTAALPDGGRGGQVWANRGSTMHAGRPAEIYADSIAPSRGMDPRRNCAHYASLLPSWSVR